MEKRLVRNVQDKKIAGVCAGLAKYFNIDPTLVRVLWIISVCALGTGVLAYAVCWFVMPEEGATQD